MHPSTPQPFGSSYPQQPTGDPSQQQGGPQRPAELDEQPAPASVEVNDLVNVDTLDPITGAPITGVGIVTAVHEDDEDGGQAGYTVALLPTLGFRVTADQLTAV